MKIRIWMFSGQRLVLRLRESGTVGPAIETEPENGPAGVPEAENLIKSHLGIKPSPGSVLAIEGRPGLFAWICAGRPALEQRDCAALWIRTKPDDYGSAVHGRRRTLPCTIDGRPAAVLPGELRNGPDPGEWDAVYAAAKRAGVTGTGRRAGKGDEP